MAVVVATAGLGPVRVDLLRGGGEAGRVELGAQRGVRGGAAGADGQVGESLVLLSWKRVGLAELRLS